MKSVVPVQLAEASESPRLPTCPICGEVPSNVDPVAHVGDGGDEWVPCGEPRCMEELVR